MRPYSLLLMLVLAAGLQTALPARAAAEPPNAELAASLKAIDRDIRLRNYEKAVKRLHPLAAQGVAQAEYRLAGLYRGGRGVQRNPKRALELYRKAAVAGLADAQYALALLLLKKPGPDHREQAHHWLQAAAEQGHRKAKRKLKQVTAAEAEPKRKPVDLAQLFSLVRGNELEQLRSLADSGVSMDQQDDQGNSLLTVALRSDRHDLAKWLVKRMSRASARSKAGEQALILAARKEYEDIVQALLALGARPNAQDEAGNTALHVATRHQNTRIMAQLLKRGADPLKRNRKGLSPLQLARNLNLQKAANLYRKQGLKLPERDRQLAAPDVRSFEKSLKNKDSIYRGWPLISIASLLGEKRILEQLLAQGADTSATDPEGNTALHRAASKGQLEIARMLLAKGAPIDVRNARGETALYLAALNKRRKMVGWLLDQGANPSLETRSKSSPLLAAIRNGDAKTAALLSTRPSSDQQIHRALRAAIEQNMEPVALKLLPRDKLASIQDKQGRSLLWLAADRGLSRLVDRLVKTHPGQLAQADKGGYSPLARAIYRGHVDIAGQLIQAQSDLTTNTREGNSLLMLAVLSGKPKMLDLLLPKGLNVNERNQHGDTALMLAASAGDQAMVERLIQAGADTQIRNRNNLTAEQIARNAGHKTVADYIRKHKRGLFKLFE